MITMLAFLFPMFIGCTSLSPDNSLVKGQSDTQRTSQRINGFRRTYRLHAPKNYNPTNSYPLLVAIHGAFSGARQMETETGLSAWADREGVIVVYPNGMSLFGFLRHWNAGHCCGKAAKDQLDDIGFLSEVIQKTTAEWPIDVSRIYVVGFSNGGMLAQRFAAEQSETIAAAACVAGAIGSRTSSQESFCQITEPVTSVPMLIIHSRTDTHVPYDGGTIPKKPTNQREYLSVEKALQFWKLHNGCEGEPFTEALNNGLIQHRIWSSKANAPVELYAIDDWPHQWPGPYFTTCPETKQKLGSFDATEAVGSFFLQQRKKPRGYNTK